MEQGIASATPERATRWLIPQFILDRLARREMNGSFPAAGLFLDLSGFTQATESLMRHGPYGAEVLASIVGAAFEPLVETVFAHGGFIVGFAGDSFTAVFPRQPDEGETDNAWRAATAAWHMHRRMREAAEFTTPLGSFQIRGKVGLALGDADWNIFESPGGRQAVYFFHGAAISHCAVAENSALPDEVIVTPQFHAALAGRLVVEEIEDRLRLIDINGSPAEARPVAVHTPDAEGLSRFVSPLLVDRTLPGEFRQALSLFVSLKDVTDSADVARFLAVLFPLRRQYGGHFYRVNFDDKGCNLQLFWGAPVSRENDIARALGFILDLSQTSPIPLRAGLSYRMAYAGYVGSSLYEEYTCLSRGVNLAARMMMAADWGDIWLDEEVAQRAEQRFVIERMGRRSLKGFDEPQAICRLTAARSDAAAGAYYRGKLSGREHELAQLESALRPLLDGRLAGAILILGEPGMGKSRLAHEFLSTSPAAAQSRVLLCQTDEILRRPLNPFRYCLRQFFEQSPLHDEELNRLRFSESLDELIRHTTDAELSAELRRTSSFLGSLIDLHWPDSLYEQVEPQLRAENTLAALKTFFKALSLRRPLIIHLEDAHALDADSREFLRRLLRNVDDYPIALLMTSREPLERDQLPDDAPQLTLSLGPLDDAALSGLIESAFAVLPSPAFLRKVAAHTDGNPFFAEQLLHYLRENDLWEAFQEEQIHPGAAQLFLPTDVRSLLVTRLDRLPPRVKEAVQVASVLGREFEIKTLSSVLEQSDDLTGALQTGVESNIWHAIDRERYLFRHALLRDAAYEMQLVTRRRALHLRAADALVAAMPHEAPGALRPAEIAYHYDRAEAAAPAAQYYGLAGEQAAEDYFNEQAIVYFSRALELAGADDVETHYRLLSGREGVYHLVGRRAEQQDDLVKLADLADGQADARRRAEVRLRCTAYSLATSDYEKAAAQAGEAATLARQSGDLLAEARAYHRLGRASWQRGQAVEAEPHLQKALALAQAVGSESDAAECLYDLGMTYYYLGSYPEATQLAHKALGIFQSLKDRPNEIRCLNLLGIINAAFGDYGASMKVYEQALAICREAGWRFAESKLLLNLGNNLLEFGDYERTRVQYRLALASFKETGDREGESITLDSMGLTYHLEGNQETARAYFEQALAVARAIANERSTGYVLTHLGFALVAAGEVGAAVNAFQEAIACRRAQGNEALMMDTLIGLAEAQAVAGRPDEALTVVHRVLTWVEENGPGGLEFPALAYLVAYRVLRAQGRADSRAAAEAGKALSAGRAFLQERADAIQDDALRRQYLTSVPYNRDLLAAANAHPAPLPES